MEDGAVQWQLLGRLGHTAKMSKWCADEYDEVYGLYLGVWCEEIVPHWASSINHFILVKLGHEIIIVRLSLCLPIVCHLGGRERGGREERIEEGGRDERNGVSCYQRIPLLPVPNLTNKYGFSLYIYTHMHSHSLRPTQTHNVPILQHSESDPWHNCPSPFGCSWQ